MWILWNTIGTTEQLEAPTLSICENGGVAQAPRGPHRWAASNNNGEQRFVFQNLYLNPETFIWQGMC